MKRQSVRMLASLDQAHAQGKDWYMSMSPQERKAFLAGLMKTLDDVSRIKSRTSRIEVTLEAWQLALMAHALLCRLTDYEISEGGEIFKDDEVTP